MMIHFFFGGRPGPRFAGALAAFFDTWVLLNTSGFADFFFAMDFTPPFLLNF
jgi:hypothetical protein